MHKDQLKIYEINFYLRINGMENIEFCMKTKNRSNLGSKHVFDLAIVNEILNRKY